MARKFSTGLRNAILGLAPSKTGTGISGTSSTKRISDTGNGMAIFQPGDIIIVPAALVAAGVATVVTVQTDGSYLTVAETVLDQGAGGSYTVALANARGFKQLFSNMVMDIYSGSQPADADATEGAGTKLARITLSSGAFTPGVATNGLEFSDPVDTVVGIKSGETWSGAGLADGTAAWFRCYSNLVVTGGSTVAIRFDGTCTLSGGGGQAILSTLAVTTGLPVAVLSAAISLGA